jgi:thiazole synthase ThiGH ThiG subunit
MRVAAQVPVQVQTLDHMTRELERVDLLKLDVQGFERQVLAGGHETLQRTTALLIEANFVSHYASDDSFGTLTELLARAGFELWDLSPPFHAPNGRALWCDAVFVKPALV